MQMMLTTLRKQSLLLDRRKAMKKKGGLKTLCMGDLGPTRMVQSKQVATMESQRRDGRRIAFTNLVLFVYKLILEHSNQ